MNTPTLPPDDDPPAWQAQRDALRQLHREVLDEPIPPALLAAAGLADEQRAPAQPDGCAGAAWRRALPSPSAPDGWPTRNGLHRRPATAAGTRAGRAGIRACRIGAHAVYAPEKRHPVEVAAAERQHLAQWLSKRLDKPLQVPDLSAEGYALVGGRLLPGSEGAPGTVHVRTGRRRARHAVHRQPRSGADPSRPGETAFRFSSDGPVPSFYWVDRGFGYALAGALSRDALLSLATVVYRQLEKTSG